jgi:hypothetical protein
VEAGISHQQQHLLPQLKFGVLVVVQYTVELVVLVVPQMELLLSHQEQHINWLLEQVVLAVLEIVTLVVVVLDQEFNSNQIH